MSWIMTQDYKDALEIAFRSPWVWVTFITALMLLLLIVRAITEERKG